MNIHTLIEAIENKSVDEFTEWLDSVEKNLSNFLYRLSGKDLYELNYDSIFFNSITKSEAYKYYEVHGSPSGAFTRFMEMIAVTAERLALIGIDSMLNNLLASLPETGARYRLEALIEFSQVENISIDYFEKLPKVLSLLAKSQLLDEDHNIRSSVDIITFFLEKAKQA
ncbi:MAG TPA: hypothetical protein VKB19_13075, partial [Pedobacter sp.]|nr:hypothetical protein [Pedobacter sp.]